MTGGLQGRQAASACSCCPRPLRGCAAPAPRGAAARWVPPAPAPSPQPPQTPCLSLPYRYRLRPCYGLCAGVSARLLGVALCWCVEGHGVLRYCALPRVVLRGVGVRRRVLCGDAVLGGRGVLGRGVGLSHRVRWSRGVLVALQRQQRRAPYLLAPAALPEVLGLRPAWGALWGSTDGPQSPPTPPPSDGPPLPSVPTPTSVPSPCCSSSRAALPAVPAPWPSPSPLPTLSPP